MFGTKKETVHGKGLSHQTLRRIQKGSWLCREIVSLSDRKLEEDDVSGNEWILLYYYNIWLQGSKSGNSRHKSPEDLSMKENIVMCVTVTMNSSHYDCFYGITTCIFRVQKRLQNGRKIIRTSLNLNLAN